MNSVGRAAAMLRAGISQLREKPISFLLNFSLLGITGLESPRFARKKRLLETCLQTS